MKTAARKHIRGFTLVEMLGVIFIIALLIGLLIPAISHVRIIAKVGATKQSIASIKTALDGYQGDFGAYPPSLLDNSGHLGLIRGSSADALDTWQGGEILAQAMFGPMGATPPTTNPNLYGDGRAGFGFSVNGRNYGPYLEDKNDGTLRPRWDQNGDVEFALDESWDVDDRIVPGQSYGDSMAEGRYAISMPYSRTGRPFLYFEKQSNREAAQRSGNSSAVAGTSADFGQPGSIISDEETATFSMLDNANLLWQTADGNLVDPEKGLYDGNPYVYLQSLDAEDRNNLAISLRSAKYLLWHPGPDDAFGTHDDILEGAGITK